MPNYKISFLSLSLFSLTFKNILWPSWGVGDRPHRCPRGSATVANFIFTCGRVKLSVGCVCVRARACVRRHVGRPHENLLDWEVPWIAPAAKERKRFFCRLWIMNGTSSVVVCLAAVAVITSERRKVQNKEGCRIINEFLRSRWFDCLLLWDRVSTHCSTAALQASRAVRTADPPAHGRRSAAIGGGISSRRAITCYFYELGGAGTLFANNQWYRNAVPLRPNTR